MASITKRGERWRAEVRRKGYASQCRTFATRAQAAQWARSVETQIDAGAPITALAGATTVGDAIRAYRRLRESTRPIKDISSEHYQLKMLLEYLGDEPIHACTPERLAAFAARRRDEDRAGLYTINMDIGRLGTVLRYAAPVLKMQFPDVVGAARPLLTHLRLIGSGGKRERRPVEDELRRVLEWLQGSKGARYADAVEFAAASAMRRGEVCALRVADVDVTLRVAAVARKHPRKGKTIERVPLLSRAWGILQRQTPENGLYFPVHPQTLSRYFKEACDALSTPDLHLHDMRHEGTSRLFEEGYSIEQVALVTGHKDWRHLKRYTNLRPEDLTRREAGKHPDSRPRRGNPPSDSGPQGTS